MAKNGFKIFDSDMHIMEPPDLWERYIDKKFQARAPRGITSHNVRDLRLAHPDGTEWAHKSTPQNNTARGQNFDKKQDIFGRDAARGWSFGRSSSKRWTTKASTSRCFIQPAG